MPRWRDGAPLLQALSNNPHAPPVVRQKGWRGRGIVGRWSSTHVGAHRPTPRRALGMTAQAREGIGAAWLDGKQSPSGAPAGVALSAGRIWAGLGSLTDLRVLLQLRYCHRRKLVAAALFARERKRPSWLPWDAEENDPLGLGPLHGCSKAPGLLGGCRLSGRGGVSGVEK